MKYAIQTHINFTKEETLIQETLKAQLDALNIKQFESDDSYVTSDPDSTITAILRFDEKESATADELYNTLTTYLSPSSQEFKTFVEIHECYHDEQPPRPCHVIRRSQL